MSMTKTEIGKILAACPKFEILERIKGLVFYVYKVDTKNRFKHALGITKTECGANQKISAYCKKNKIENYITMTKTNTIG